MNGVGYVVFCSNSTIADLSNIGEERIGLEIETIVREDQITLYGFASAIEKEWFLLLNKVNGVGPKMALGILSSISLENLSFAIASGDKAAFKPVSGVGPKLADRLITELKDKVGMIAIDNVVSINSTVSSGQSNSDRPSNEGGENKSNYS